MVKKMSKNINFKNRPLDWFIQLIGIFVNLEILYILFNLTRYSSFSSIIFLIINGIGLLLLVFIDLAIILSIRKKSRNMSIVILIVFVFFVVFSTATVYLINRVNKGVDEIVVNPVQTETVAGVFITYNKDNITDIEDTENKQFGIVSGDDIQEGNRLAKIELEKESISVNFVEYNNYNDLYLGLLAGEVDVAAMPSDYYSLFIVNDGYEEYLDKTNEIYHYEAKVEVTSESNTSFDVTKTPFTVLIMGNDGRLSDTLIIATFNPFTFKATLTSIARDSYVPIACYKNQESDKITHARVISRQCTIDTVQNLMDIKIDFFAEVNFKGVVEIVDALGGVLINSPIEFVGQSSDSERGHYTVWVPSGTNYLNGEQTLAFARERKLMPGGDYQRQLNQQQVIKQLINSVLATKDVNVILSILDAASNNIKTNMSLEQMLSLFNYTLTAMNSSFVESEKVLEITGSRVTGYGSTNYNEQMELPLWIYRLYKGAIEDNRDFILQNLKYDYEPEIPEIMRFNVSWWIERPLVYLEEYNEEKIHDVIPDIMPNMLNDKDGVWTYERVKEWAKTRNIALNVSEIRTGSALYSDAYVHNQIVTQSEKYGRRTSKISNLTIGVIKKVLDCSIYDNRKYEECQDIVEDFIWNTTLDDLTEIRNWATQNNVTIQYTWITSDDSFYDVSKAGKVYAQDPIAYTKIPTDRVIKLQVYDYPFVEIPKVEWTEAQVDEFARKLLNSIEQITYIRKYDASKNEGTVLKVEPVYIERYLATKKFRTIDKLTLTLSTKVEPALTIPNFVGSTETDLKTWLTSNGLNPSITKVEEINEANAGKIISISPNISNTSTYTKSTFPTSLTLTVGKKADSVPATP